MIYSIENYKDIVQELDTLLPIAYAEIDRYPEEPTPDIDHDAFIAIPTLQAVTARVAGELVGFHVSMISNDIFYKTILTAYVMFYYMLPEHRGNGRGTGMFKYAEEEYKDKDVDRIFMSRKIYIPNEKMFSSLGYTHLESNYTKAMNND